MNQSIQFPDREEWHVEHQAVVFPALVGGMQVFCAISKLVLAQRFGEHTAEEYLNLFRSHRWDLEEEAEVLINAQQEDAQGWYWLS
ncbi:MULTISPECIES: DUF1488 domain-containing protein [Mangrovibacter]|uniref:Uncharacterized protein DUF1488 n=1 Tax=Mangrovibacter plantisponsor TaxID=451513 RepID=A0A317PIT5_9ENTR|nr:MULTISPECIES: DUF1488 domain-containing protein [Mangrovibacter]KEA51191.1 hypothetical protein DT73_19035 [Mangrovibacter sp. MFB070]PWV99584.1 uncharacterized protein DUF1488 [Mangrovibacter plantisponsor]